MVAAAAYAPPLRASITPVFSKATIPAKAPYAAAGPLERPTTPAMFAWLGVTSNWASKVPVWEAMESFCQAPALVRQVVAMSKAGRVFAVLGPVVRVDSHASARTTLAATAAFNRASRLDSLNLKFILGLLLTCFVGNRKGRRELEDFLGFAGGPADVATYIALVPWLCDTAFRRLCSEQRDRIFVDGSATLLASAVLHRSHRPIACASGAS